MLDEIQDNTREAGQRLRASLNLMRSQSMTEDGNYDDLATRLRTVLAIVESACVEAKKCGLSLMHRVTSSTKSVLDRGQAHRQSIGKSARLPTTDRATPACGGEVALEHPP